MESLVICSSLAVSTASYRLALTGLPIQLALSGFRKIQDEIPDLALISFRSVPGEKEEQAGRSLARGLSYYCLLFLFSATSQSEVQARGSGGNTVLSVVEAVPASNKPPAAEVSMLTFTGVGDAPLAALRCLRRLESYRCLFRELKVWWIHHRSWSNAAGRHQPGQTRYFHI